MAGCWFPKSPYAQEQELWMIYPMMFPYHIPMKLVVMKIVMLHKAENWNRHLGMIVCGSHQG